MARRRGRLQLSRRHRRILLRAGVGAFGVAVIIGVVVLLLGPVATWAGGSTVWQLTGKERADAINAVRQTLLQAAAGVAALSVLAFTGMTFLLNRRGQVTDRYAKAIGMLASDKRDERIGGIYALEHIMIESERDHETVVQVLAAFIREHAPAPSTETDHPVVNTAPTMTLPASPPDVPTDEEPEPEADIQAALTVLARRPQRDETRTLDLRRTDLRGADLSKARLNHANLKEANLEQANLDRAHLEHADLSAAHLEKANLHGAHLEKANLAGAHLEQIILGYAHLEGADLSWANLESAILEYAHLKDASLVKANLENAVLFGAQLEHANFTSACMKWTNLKLTRLEHASFSAAYLERANLSGAYFKDTFLKDADLKAANLANTDLREAADLTQDQIDAAIINANTKLPPSLTMGEAEASTSEPTS